jgi:2-polyprenyl-6-hydroxyphenyl methylase/3-demethylubiquinone-9 3-methyltransferase
MSPGRCDATLSGVKSYYEELWERLPDELVPADFERRRDFLLANLTAGERALDLGCGTGVFTAELTRAGAHAVGVEVAEAALVRARTQHPSIDFRLAPIDGPLPLEESAVDLIWCSEVIEHVGDTARWLSEVRRVLAPRGRLLITTPSHGRFRLAVLGVERFSEPLGDHLHLYTRRSLEQLLREFGFGEIEIRSVGGAPLLRQTLLARATR